jgi:hypothetical protein
MWGEWAATVLGTGLFGTANLINSIRGAVHKNKHTDKINGIGNKIKKDLPSLLLANASGQTEVVEAYKQALWADYAAWEFRQAVKRFGRNNPFKKKKSPVMFKL